MNPVFLLRIGLNFLALSLFMAAMAYWWMGNLFHEMVGTGMFALLLLHNVFNRRWYGGLLSTRRQLRSLVTVGLNLVLLGAMVTLLTTSVLISQSLFGFLAVGGPSARDIHILAAYWALIIASLHLGLHWSIVMNSFRALVGSRQPGFGQILVLRAISVALVGGGIMSSFELEIGSRLLLIPTMQFWDFNEDAAGFFYRIASICGLYVTLGHYANAVLQVMQRPRPSRRQNHPAAVADSRPETHS